jgi:SAM-dependent methyltransferase
MSGLDEAVLDYYERNARREHERLDRADCALEFELTTRLLARHVPAGARVLELGGGSGRYTRWLAERGHRVVLTDLSPALVELAREHLRGAGPAVEEVAAADARDLSRWEAGSFGAVVALGPFYHIVDEDGRRRAAAEMARVLRPGGVACVALISRYAVLRGVLADPAARGRLGDPRFLRALLDEGVFANDQPGRFTGAYGVEPARAAELLDPRLFAVQAVHAVEGFASDLQGAVAELRSRDPVACAALLDALHERSADPSFFGTSNHLLLVAHRTPDAV